MLNTWDKFWGPHFEQCPCDLHFVEWLEASAIRNQSIYHFGSGGHHYVGIRCAEPHLNNAVLSITASLPEFGSWVQLAKNRPELTKTYCCYFGDIYTTNPKLLPTFDLVTLFHSCEFRSEKNDAYGALTDRQVMDIFTGATRAGGHLLFYGGSSAFEAAEPVIAEWARHAPVVRVDDFKSLIIYRKNS
jgi:hypothetical protein